MSAVAAAEREVHVGNAARLAGEHGVEWVVDDVGNDDAGAGDADVGCLVPMVRCVGWL